MFTCTCICVCVYKYTHIHVCNNLFTISMIATVKEYSFSYNQSVNFYSEVGESNGTPLQYSCLENPIDGVAWQAAVHGIVKSQTRLSDFTFTFHLHALEMKMATHSNVLAQRISGTGEPGGLPSVGSHRVGHN